MLVVEIKNLNTIFKVLPKLEFSKRKEFFLYKREFEKVLETFDFLNNMREDESRVVRKYEDRLISACERAAISKNTIIVVFIIAFYF